ncbi:hypothetical protein XENOCAPTIV_019523 [Xenoophorus captivus]|uniref:Uncharacterized protein n=1 Tax=Xenoophorus captivus TaxID=1517983 RepID=A0ABV0S8C1_9TELE
MHQYYFQINRPIPYCCHSPCCMLDYNSCRLFVLTYHPVQRSVKWKPKINITFQAAITVRKLLTRPAYDSNLLMLKESASNLADKAKFWFLQGILNQPLFLFAVFFFSLVSIVIVEYKTTILFYGVFFN